MRKKNREINIFSMSALDLFASAMGAFLLIAVMALPYYLKVDPELIEKIKKLESDLTSITKTLTQSQSQIAALEKDNKQLKMQLEKCEAHKQQLERDIQLLQKENEHCKSQKDALEKENNKLKKEIENSVKFALLGINTKANSFVVVMDMSGSMDKYTAIMLKTVKRILEPLRDDSTVQIIGYRGGSNGTELHSWQTPHNMQIMIQNNKSDANRFVSDMSKRYGGGTPTQDALREALKYNAEAIILLTDGAPDNKANDIIRDITQLNSGKKEIHSIAIGDYNSDQSLVDFLMELSKQNNGEFMGISK